MSELTHGVFDTRETNPPINQPPTDRERQLEADLARCREMWTYWSYCTWRGMSLECPELTEQLRDWLASLGIKPYACSKPPPQTWDALPDAEKERLGRAVHEVMRVSPESKAWRHLSQFEKDRRIDIARAVWEASHK